MDITPSLGFFGYFPNSHLLQASSLLNLHSLARCVLPLASGLCYRSQSLLKSSSSVMLG